MAIRLKLGSYETVRNDPVGRTHIGYFPRMTEQEAWEAGRAMWKMNADKARRQRFALIVGEGIVRAVGEITDLAEHDIGIGRRIELRGQVLPEGHPVRGAYLGQTDPVANGSQNPVGYCELSEELPFLHRPCACGCGKEGDRDFLSGHDVRAIQARVREHFAGSPLKFVQWVDQTLAATPAARQPTR